MSENQRTGLTDRELRKLGPGDHADGKIAGLVFRVRQTGGRSWAYLYRANGRRRRLTLGAYPALGVADARAAARAARKAVSLGRDPALERRQAREADTFGALAERYLERWAKPRKKTWRDDERKLKTHVLPRWKHLPVREITRRDARELLEKIEAHAPIGVNRTRALLSKIFNYGIGIDVVNQNPIIGTTPNREQARDRVLNDEEIRKLWKATEPRPEGADEDDERMMPAMAARFRLQLVTAQRGGEVNGMRWSELDLGAGIWTIPAERSKNRLAHRVPLSPLALEMLESLPRKGNYVLYLARGARQQRDAARTIGLDDFKPHDLRRTAASYMASLGVPRLVIGKVLNHVERDITAVYDRHGYDREKRDALERWALELRRIVSGEAKGAGVVEFPR